MTSRKIYERGANDEFTSNNLHILYAWHKWS